jgi:2Fe-2S iron-sulfur cluster binding domain
LVAELQKRGLMLNTPVSGEFPITLNINGTEHTLYIEPRVSLLDALRERLGFTGTKKECNHGQCGACTVLVNSQRINSCLKNNPKNLFGAVLLLTRDNMIDKYVLKRAIRT